LANKCGVIALAGRPNAGKSTFLNLCLGEKVSIVSDKAQTTRNRILGVYHGAGVQIGFLDLPGIHKPKYRMNRQMMRLVNQGLDAADLIFHFVDISVPTGSGDSFVSEYLKRFEMPVIMVLNKMDLVNKTKAIDRIAALHERFKPAELVPLSSLTGDNLDRLLEVAAGYLPDGDGLYPEDELTNQPLRFMAQELIREKLLHYTRDEIPHAVAVTLEEFRQEEETGGYAVSAVVWVERTSQRRIILGTGGASISKIRSAARASLKKLLGCPVQLELFVKVEDGWRNKEAVLERLKLADE